MVEITETEPSRFREGDLIAIRGIGFSPTFGQNAVAIDGIPEPVQSESEDEIQVLVPAGVAVDAYVSITVFRSDTLDGDLAQAWSSAPVDDLRSGLARVPGQVPGQVERADPTRVEDVPQAQDYERLVTAIEHLLFDTLSAVGDLFASDGTDLVPHPVGVTPGHRLGANPATGTGLEYAAKARAHSLEWAGGKDPSDVTLGGLAADGQLGQQLQIPEQLAGVAGTIFKLTAYFSFGNGSLGETLDQVVLEVNGAPVHDSGTGLGIPPGGSYEVALATAVVATDVVAVLVKKLGGTSGIESSYSAFVGIR